MKCNGEFIYVKLISEIDSETTGGGVTLPNDADISICRLAQSAQHLWDDGAERHLPAAGAEKFEVFSHFYLENHHFPLKTSLTVSQTTQTMSSRRATRGRFQHWNR